jgi:hypothetical protein
MSSLLLDTTQAKAGRAVAGWARQAIDRLTQPGRDWQRIVNDDPADSQKQPLNCRDVVRDTGIETAETASQTCIPD